MQMFWNRAVGIAESAGWPMLFAQAEKPAHEELGPALAAAQAALCGLRYLCSPRPVAPPCPLPPEEGNTTQTPV